MSERFTGNRQKLHVKGAEFASPVGAVVNHALILGLLASTMLGIKYNRRGPNGRRDGRKNDNYDRVKATKALLRYEKEAKEDSPKKR